MSVDWGIVTNISMAVLSIGMGLLLFSLRDLSAQIRLLQKRLVEIETDMAKNYVSKSDFSDALTRIERGLDRIYDKLEGKADK